MSNPPTEGRGGEAKPREGIKRSANYTLLLTGEGIIAPTNRNTKVNHKVNYKSNTTVNYKRNTTVNYKSNTTVNYKKNITVKYKNNTTVNYKLNATVAINHKTTVNAYSKRLLSIKIYYSHINIICYCFT